VTNGKKTQAACEDNILRLLITAEGPLLDNLELIATLDTSKETWEKVNKFKTTMAQTSPQKQTNKQTNQPKKKHCLILIKMLGPISKYCYY
jgi:dynein heavy chain